MRHCGLLALVAWSSLAAFSGAAAQSAPRPLSLSELQSRVAADSNDPVLHLDLGRALLKHKKYDEAERRFRVAASLAPGLAEAYLGIAGLPAARGEGYWKRIEKRDGRDRVVAAWTEAERFFRLAFMLDPLVEPGLMPRAEERVTLRMDGTNYRVWWVLPLSKGINAFRAGKYEEAKRKLDKLVEDPAAGPDGLALPDDALWFRALAAAHLNDYHAAATGFTMLMTRATQAEQEPGIAAMPLLANDYRYLAAIMLDLAGQPEVSALMLREALGMDPSLFMAHSQLARIHERAGRWDEAITERRRAVDANPDNGDLAVDLGFTLLRANKVEAAFDAFEQARAINRRDPRPPYQQGLLALQLERPEIVRQSFERFLALAPSRMEREVIQARRHLGTTR